MKKYLIILCVLLLTGCSLKLDFKENNSNNESNDKKVEEKIDPLTLEKIDSEEEKNTEIKEKEEEKSQIEEQKVEEVKEEKKEIQKKDEKTETKVEEKVEETKKEENKVIEPKKEEQKVEVPKEDIDLSGVSSKGYEIKRVNGIYYVKGILIANKTYSLPSDYNPGGLLSEFNTAFNKMKQDAAKEGISLWVASGFRAYSLQSALYKQYSNSYGSASADTFSARPGHSEHQTGLAADLNQINEAFGNTAAGKWLANNCYKYGFILRYPKNKQSITGYIYEPWHFRYIGEEAKNLYNDGEWITLEEYLGIDSKYSN